VISRIVDREAPAERLAAFRIAVGTFVLVYLTLRLPMFAALADRPAAAFDGRGLFAAWPEPLPPAVFRAAIAATFAAGVAAVIGWRHRVSAPAFALGVLVLTSYRSSWGQLLHFENLFTLHLCILAVAPAADAWSLDARRRAPAARRPTDYGFPLALACLVVVTTYVIAGIAKLRYGGIEWVVGDALRNHIAASAARLELLGGSPAPLAELVVPLSVLFPPMAAWSLLVELAAPVALLGGRWRSGWVIAVWTMHLGIFAFMFVGFPYPLFLVAFAPFFAIERVVRRG
jgi:hypothetical protein